MFSLVVFSYFFFFFKQKTAYDMRISDWSSDVCSSDLSATSMPLPLVGSWSLDASLMPEKERPQRVTMTFRASQDGKWTTRVEIVGPDGFRKHAESTAALDGVPVPEIGRASCRERVCQYV